jgi:predicted O-methyltransferase YrrM
MDQQIINFLRQLKQYGLDHDVPNVTEKGGRFLNMLVKITNAKSVLEIGCANGYSTIWLAEAAVHNKGKVSTIDFSKPTFESAKINLDKAGLSDAVDFYFGNALEVIPTIKKPDIFNLVFVDGEKKSYWDFWEAIQGRLSSNAVVVFDDVLSFPEKTQPFMEKIKNVLGFDQVVLPIDDEDGILLLLKT